MTAPRAVAAASALPPDAGPAARETRRLTASEYALRGLKYAARPRPEDQKEAERLFHKALDLDPDQPRAHAGLARVSTYLYTLGLEETPERLDGAVAAAGRAVELAPGDAMARAALAAALVAADRLTPALQEARGAVAIDPDDAGARALLGQILRLRGDLEEAETECRRAAAVRPDDPRVLTALGDVLRDRERYAEALEMHGQAIDLDQEAIAPQLGAAATLQRAGQVLRARHVYNTLLDRWDYGKARALLGAGALLLAQEDCEGALALYGRIELPANGSLPTLLVLYGKAWCLQRLERGAEAEYFLTTLVDRVPPGYDGPARGRDLLFRAYDDLVRFFHERGREDRAEALLRAAADRPLVPTHLVRDLAARLHAGGRGREAVARLARAIAGADRREDALELADSALLLARQATRDGRRPLDGGSEPARALQQAQGHLASDSPGAAHYRLARAFALAGLREAAFESLERARDGGYLPADQATGEPDFRTLHDDSRFRALLDR
ncbi:MAG: tetratricopeptide repeat protein [Candidatus Polarisedimenticolia bacterium]